MISVIMPVRNGEPWLDRAVESITAQTDPDWELVAVDDGSEDGTAAILSRWSSAHERVRVLRLGGPMGLAAALNAGVEAARGRFIARMDADDVSLPDRLATQRAMMENDPGLDLVSCRVRAFSDNGEAPEGMRVYVDWVNGIMDMDQVRRNLFVESPFPHPSVVMRADSIRAAGGYRKYAGPEDYELWLRMAGLGMRFAKSPETLLLWRDDPGRVSRTSPDFSPQAFQDIKLEYLLKGPLEGRAEVVVWGAGKGGKRWGWQLRERGLRVPWFVDIDPKKFGNVIGDAAVVRPEALPGLEPRPFILAAVGTRGARDHIRGLLAELGFRELEDFLCVA